MTSTEIVILNGPHKGKVLQHPAGVNARGSFRLLKPRPRRPAGDSRDSLAEAPLRAQTVLVESVDYDVAFFGAGDAEHSEVHRYAVECGTPTDSATLFKLIHGLLLERLTHAER